MTGAASNRAVRIDDVLQHSVLLEFQPGVVTFGQHPDAFLQQETMRKFLGFWVWQTA